MAPDLSRRRANTQQLDAISHLRANGDHRMRHGVSLPPGCWRNLQLAKGETRENGKLMRRIPSINNPLKGQPPHSRSFEPMRTSEKLSPESHILSQDIVTLPLRIPPISSIWSAASPFPTSLIAGYHPRPTLSIKATRHVSLPDGTDARHGSRSTPYWR